MFSGGSSLATHYRTHLKKWSDKKPLFSKALSQKTKAIIITGTETSNKLTSKIRMPVPHTISKSIPQLVELISTLGKVALVVFSKTSTKTEAMRVWSVSSWQHASSWLIARRVNLALVALVSMSFSGKCIVESTRSRLYALSSKNLKHLKLSFNLKSYCFMIVIEVDFYRSDCTKSMGKPVLGRQISRFNSYSM